MVHLLVLLSDSRFFQTTNANVFTSAFYLHHRADRQSGAVSEFGVFLEEEGSVGLVFAEH